MLDQLGGFLRDGADQGQHDDGDGQLSALDGALLADQVADALGKGLDVLAGDKGVALLMIHAEPQLAGVDVHSGMLLSLFGVGVFGGLGLGSAAGVDLIQLLLQVGDLLLRLFDLLRDLRLGLLEGFLLLHPGVDLLLEHLLLFGGGVLGDLFAGLGQLRLTGLQLSALAAGFLSLVLGLLQALACLAQLVAENDLLQCHFSIFSFMSAFHWATSRRRMAL